MRWLLALALAGSAVPSAAADDSPTFHFELTGRSACVTPCTRAQARADGGSIDVRTPAPNNLAVRMTGTTAAISYLCCASSATERFQLVQDFEITCSDPRSSQVVLTLDSTLVGYVSTARKAGACMRLANATVTPAQWDSSPLALAHPPMCASGGEARQCNQHLAPLQGPPMPLGRYTLVANLVIDCTAGGVCNARAAADFSPDTKLPSEWVTTRDPFPNANKDGFGFFLNLVAAPPGPASPATAPTVKPPSSVAPSPPVRARPLSMIDLGRPGSRLLYEPSFAARLAAPRSADLPGPRARALAITGP